MFEDATARQQVTRWSDDVHKVFEIVRSDSDLAFRIATIGGKIALRWNLYKLKHRNTHEAIEYDITSLWEELNHLETKQNIDERSAHHTKFNLKETFIKLFISALLPNEAVEFVMNNKQKFVYGHASQPQSKMEKARIILRTQKVVLVRGALRIASSGEDE